MIFILVLNVRELIIRILKGIIEVLDFLFQLGFLIIHKDRLSIQLRVVLLQIVIALCFCVPFLFPCGKTIVEKKNFLFELFVLRL